MNCEVVGVCIEAIPVCTILSLFEYLKSYPMKVITSHVPHTSKLYLLGYSIIYSIGSRQTFRRNMWLPA
jgi:hypothetical protein